MKEIYTVTVFQKVDSNPIPSNPSKDIQNFGDRRCVGWFDNFQEADCAVTNNFANMYAGMYDYAIIEKIESGILMVDTDRIVYKWNEINKKYEAIETPIEVSKSCNFGIG